MISERKIEGEFAKKLEAFEQFVLNLKEGSRQKIEVAVDTPFDGASFMVEALQNYFPFSSSANDDLNVEDRKVMIPRCRDAYNNDLLGKACVNRVVKSTVGVSGLNAKSTVDREVTGLTRKQTKKLQRFFNRAWKRFTKAKNCDVAAQDNFKTILKKLMLAKCVDGDVLVNTISKKFGNEEFFLKIQLIEGERVSNEGETEDVPPIDGQNGITQGIEHNLLGRHVAYFVREAHPGDTIDVSRVYKWKRIPAYGEATGRRRVFFISPFGRIDQKRGVPMLAVALDKLKTIKQYSRHELLAAALQALYTVFVKNISPVDDSIHNENNNIVKNPRFDQKKNVQLGSGTVAYLGKDQDVTMADPTRPNQNYEAFQMAQYKELGAGLDIPYEYLIYVFNTSYTAARASFVQIDARVKDERFDLVSDFCLPIWELFILELLEQHELPDYIEDLIDFDRLYSDRDYFDSLIGVTFSGSKIGSIDEVKDATSAKIRLETGVSEYDKEINNIHGDQDFESITERLGEQKEKRDSLGLTKIEKSVVSPKAEEERGIDEE